MRKIVPVLALVGTLGLGLIGCGNRVDPCSTIAPPTQAEIAAAASGADVEREVEINGHEYECELTNGAWVREQDTD